MRRILLVVLVAGVALLGGCVGDAGDAFDPDDTDPPVADGELAIHHLDVGQADATLVVSPAGETILIDTGDWRDDGRAVLDYLDERGIDRIDHLVATHAHADHVGGHAAVIEHFETEGDGIGRAYDSGVVHTSRTYENYLDAVEAHDVDLFEVRTGDALPTDTEGLSVTVYNPPEGEAREDLHDGSVVLTIEFGDVRYLTTGDAEGDVESRLVEQWGSDLDADVYQAGHHGSSTSSTAGFLDAVDPAVAVVSSARDSQYGHPHDEVLQRLADRDVETYWTAVHGAVVVTTDGEGVSVATAESFSTDPLDLLDAKPDESAETVSLTAARSPEGVTA